MSIDQALADLQAATGTAHLGRTVVIDGSEVAGAVKVALSTEEALDFAGGRYANSGLRVDGCRITVNPDLLSWVPVVRGTMTVDGLAWDVVRVQTVGSNLRITMVRFRG